MTNGRRTATGPVHSVAIALICIFGGPPTEMAAQEPLQPGARVRVTALDCGLRGQATGFRALRADTLVLDTTECPLASVTRLDVNREKSYPAEGFLIGHVAGLLWGLKSCHEGCSILVDDISTELTLFYGALGGLLGAIVGYAIKTDRWEEVPVERLRVSVVPQRDGGFGLGFSVSF